MWHKAIGIEVSIDDNIAPEPCQPVQVYNYHLADCNAMSSFLEGKLMEIGEHDIDAAFNTLYGILNEAIEKFVPKNQW